jgi:hypothetical protein
VGGENVAKNFTLGAKIELDGEREFKQAIQSINQSQAVLRSELTKTKAEYAGNEKSVEALTKRSEIYRKQIEEQQKKIEEMRKALKLATDTYGESDKRTKDWQIQLNRSEADLFKLTRTLEQNEKELEEARKETDESARSWGFFRQNVNEAEEGTKSFSDTLKAVGLVAAVAALGKAAKTAAGEVKELAVGAASYADNFLTMADVTGLSLQTLQEYNYMQELIDVDLNTITSSMTRMIRAMANAQRGTAEQVEAFEKLKVKYQNANGELRDAETVYWEVIDALGAMTNETERDAIAMQLMGRSARELAPLMKLGGEGIKEFRQEAHEAGAVLSDEMMEALGEADDRLQRATLRMDIARRKIGAELAPEFARASELIVSKVTSMDDELAALARGGLDLVVKGLEFVLDNHKPIISGLTGIAAGMVAFKVGSAAVSIASSAMNLYRSSTQGAATAQATLNTAQAASPMGAIAALVGVAVSGLTMYALTSREATREIEKLNEEQRRSLELIREEINSRQASREALENEYGVYRTMVEELYALATAAELTSSQKAQMKIIVDELNKALPDLNLVLNEETGILNKQKGEVIGLVEANLNLYKVKAAQEDLINIAKNQYKAEKNLKELEESRVKLQEEYNNAYSRLQNAKNSATQWDKRSLKEVEEGRARKELQALDKALEENAKSINKAKKTISELGSDWRGVTEYIADNKSVQDATKSVDELGDSLNKTTDKTKEFGDAVAETNEKITLTEQEAASKIRELTESYEEAIDKRAESIKSSMNLFDEFKVNTEVTGQQLLDNLASQVYAMEDYMWVFESLAKRNISQGLLDELRSMGVRAIGEVYALTQLTDEELNEYAKLWEDKNKLAKELATDELKGLRSETEAKIDEIKQMMEKKGEEAAKSFAAGFRKGRSEIVKEIDRLIWLDRAAGYYDEGALNFSRYDNSAVAPTSSTAYELDYTKLESIIRRAVEGVHREVILDGEKVGQYAVNYTTRELYAK